ncbi:hypothetical protein DITRI_Ditri16bG0029000 [Diplodiscus trichospermus]
MPVYHPTLQEQQQHQVLAQTTATFMVSVFYFYHRLPKKPSSFLQHTVARFEKYVAECCQWIAELEHLFLSNSDRNSINHASSLLQSVPKLMSNVHDFFVHVAVKFRRYMYLYHSAESIHPYIESMKTAYLADQRRRGEVNDSFLEADGRETAKQEAAAKRVYIQPCILPASSQSSTQVAGLCASSENPAATSAPRTSAATSSASSGGGLSLFSSCAVSLISS